MDAITRILWPQEDFAHLCDDFIVQRCRVRFEGGWITVTPYPDGAAEAVLSRYVDALRTHLRFTRAFTLEEFSSLPPRFVVINSHARFASNPHALKRDRELLGLARRDVIAPVHARLSQCYGYWQAAKHDEQHTVIHLYKMVEAIEDEYGGEREAKRLLELEQEMNRIKRWANDRSEVSRDQRHAPSSPGQQLPFTDRERAQALEDGHAILEKFASLL